MKRRWVALPIEALTLIFADYAGQIGFPPDAKPVKWMFHPQMGKLMLVVQAESLNGNQPPEEIKFALKKVYGVS